jgi:protein tyrosine phosphatase (PTP) superfamily phosphohydrolase (DUF442 family)
MKLRSIVPLEAAFFLATACIHSANAKCVSPSLVQMTAQDATDRRGTDAGNSGMHIENKLIPDFGEVSLSLYRGGQPKKQGFETLAKMGIQIVVDMRGNRKSEREEVTRLGMQYVPMPWECSFPKDRIFAAFITLIRTNPQRKIFVHCRVGDDRTGMMVAAYRMAEQGWSAERAEKEMISFGFNFIHRHLICQRLERYERDFPNRFATRPEFEELRPAQQSQPAQ